MKKVDTTTRKHRIYNAMKLIFEKYGEWGFKILLLLGMVANLWLTTNFVTRAEYERDRAQMKSEIDLFVKENNSSHLLLQNDIGGIDLSLKLLTQNQSKLDDHEARLRVNSEKIGILNSRVDVLDSTVKMLKEDKK